MPRRLDTSLIECSNSVLRDLAPTRAVIASWPPTTIQNARIPRWIIELRRNMSEHSAMQSPALLREMKNQWQVSHSYAARGYHEPVIREVVKECWPP